MPVLSRSSSIPMRWGSSESRITPIPSFLRARVSSCSTHTPKHTLKARLCERGDKNKTLVWQMVTNLQDVLRFVPFVRPFLGQLQHLRQKNVHTTVCHNQHLNSSLEIHTAFISKKLAKKSLLFSTLWVIFQCMKMSSFRTSLYSATASAERRVYKSCCYVIMNGCMLPWLHYGAVPPPYLTLWGNRAALSENHTKYNSQVKSPSFI